MKKTIFLLAILLGFMGVGSAQNATYSSLGNKDFAKIVKEKKTQVVDVRTPAEFVTGHLPQAVNIDVNSKDFDKQIEKLNKKKPVAVYCRSGRRSKVAAGKLADKGFKVYELDKGIIQWDGEIVK